MDIKELESGVDPSTHWYYQSKKIPMLRFIDSIKKDDDKFNLIDIGAGSGFFSYEINAYCPENIVKTMLVDTGYSTSEIATSKNALIQKQHELPESLQNSVVLMMDVLEHLEDDLQMLKNIKRNARAGKENHFFITVPAFQSVWSAHDVYLEHYRRYSKTSLLHVLNEASFKTDRIYYLYGSLFPLVFLKRKMGNPFSPKNKPIVSDMKPLPNWLNKLLLKYSQIEMMFTKYNSWFGLTCVAEGRF